MQVKTPVLRVPKLKSARVCTHTCFLGTPPIRVRPPALISRAVLDSLALQTVRDPSDVFLMAAPWVADAAPKPTPRLIRQQEYERVSRAKAFLLDSTTVVTVCPNCQDVCV
jgi:hypothetical protein